MRNLEKYLPYLLAGAGLYLVFKLVKAGSEASQILTNTGSAIGSSLYDVFHPDQLGEMVFYTVTFPDNSRHAIGSRDVGADGSFTWAGERWRMVTKANDPNKMKFAVAA